MKKIRTYKKYYETRNDYYFDTSTLPKSASIVFSNNTFSIFNIPTIDSNEFTITLLDDNECSPRTHLDTMTNSISEFHDNFISENDLDEIYNDYKEIKYMLALIMNGKDYKNDYIYIEYLKNKKAKDFNL